MAETGTDISRASQLLHAGALVAIPTETVYGLAANAFNAEAVARVFEVKKRPGFDPLIVHLADAEHLKEIAEPIPDAFYRLYEKLSPGPITYILPKHPKVPDLVTAGNATVGVRFPRHPLTRDLLLHAKLALAAPSANPFGYISPTSAQHVEDQLGDHIPYILDGGPCSVGLESTIIDLSKKEPAILRLGGMALSEIEETLGAPIQKVQVSSSKPQAPGMLSAHYAPRTPLLFGHMERHLKVAKGKKIGIISFCKRVGSAPEAQQHVLSPSGDLREAAAKLFASMRLLDQSGVELILAEKFPEEGLGKAINDRLQRAAFREE